VIAVDQDKLGTQGVRISPPGAARTDSNLEVWARPLADGGRAVGLFNKGAETAKATLKLSDIGMQGSHKVRDLWKHEDLAPVTGEYSADVPSHGVVMIKVAK
jgi:alpha-galactosidase